MIIVFITIFIISIVYAYTFFINLRLLSCIFGCCFFNFSYKTNFYILNRMLDK